MSGVAVSRGPVPSRRVPAAATRSSPSAGSRESERQPGALRDHGDKVCLCDQIVADTSASMVFAVPPCHSQRRGIEKKLIPRHNRAGESAILDAGKYVYEVGLVQEAQAAEQGAGLGQRFHDQQLRHAKVTPDKTFEKRFVPRNVLDCSSRLHWHKFKQAIYQHEGVPMREPGQDPCNVHIAASRRSSHAWSSRGFCDRNVSFKEIGQERITGSGLHRHGCAETLRVRRCHPIGCDR